MTDAAVLAGWVATGSEDRLAENLPVVPKRPVYRRKGQPVPRNRVPLEQIELESLRPNGHVRLRQAGAEDELDLRDAGDRVDRQQLVDLQFCARLFPGLTPGAGRSGFLQLQEAGRQGPEAAARLDGAPTEQDAPLPGGDGADDDLGILVGDKAAVAPPAAAAGVPLRDPAPDNAGVRHPNLERVGGRKKV